MAGFWREQIKRITRSSGWGKVRSERIKLDGGLCRCCGKKMNLQVHHIHPFHQQPELELDIDNTITFCGRCHLLVGHLDYWKSANLSVLADTNTINQRIKGRT